MTRSDRNPEPPSPWGPLLAFVATWLLLLAAMLTSCSPKVVENVRFQRDTAYVERVQVDSVYRRDSLFIREKGDTIYIYKEKIRDRYKFIRDTVRLVRVDSVAVDRIKEVKVKRPLSMWQVFSIVLGRIALVVAALFMAVKFLLKKLS